MRTNKHNMIARTAVAGILVSLMIPAIASAKAPSGVSWGGNGIRGRVDRDPQSVVPSLKRRAATGIAMARMRSDHPVSATKRTRRCVQTVARTAKGPTAARAACPTPPWR